MDQTSDVGGELHAGLSHATFNSRGAMAHPDGGQPGRVLHSIHAVSLGQPARLPVRREGHILPVVQRDI